MSNLRFNPLGSALAAFKFAARGILASSLIYPLLRKRALRGSPVTVLVYHSLGYDGEGFDAWTVLEATRFEEQLRHLQSIYKIVSIDEIADRTTTHDDRPLAVITFDDGEAGLARFLPPILDRLKVPVTIFVATEQIETGQPYWFDRLINRLQAVGPFSVDLRDFNLGCWDFGSESGEQRWLLISEVLEAIKTLPPNEIESATARVFEQTDQVLIPSFTAMTPMTKNQLKTLAQHDCITIGAHSHCHRLLDRLNLSEAGQSIQTSVSRLKDWTGFDIKHFAFPNGNTSVALRDVVETQNLRSACGMSGNLFRPQGDVFDIPRVAIGRYDDINRFKLRLAQII